jgi:hypothetical protein
LREDKLTIEDRTFLVGLVCEIRDVENARFVRNMLHETALDMKQLVVNVLEYRQVDPETVEIVRDIRID